MPGVVAAKAAFDLHQPDVALIDLGFADGSGIDVIRHIAQRSTPERECLTMVVSVFGDEKHVVESIAAGAAGYVLKDTADDRFLAAVHDLVAGGAPISPGIARHLLKEVRRNVATAPKRPVKLPMTVDYPSASARFLNRQGLRSGDRTPAGDLPSG